MTLASPTLAATLPSWLPLVLVVAGLVLIAGFLVAHFLGVGGGAPRGRFRAALTELGERTGDLANQFWDWLRLGR